MKQCNSCGNKLPRSSFNRDKTRSDGLSPYCRICKSKKAKRYYSTTNLKDKLRVKNKNRRLKIRQWLFEYLLKHPCSCGEANPACLDFDHVDPREKECNVSRMASRGASLEIVQEEIDKCSVVCANCHRKRTAADQSWYYDLVRPVGLEPTM